MATTSPKAVRLTENKEPEAETMPGGHRGPLRRDPATQPSERPALHPAISHGKMRPGVLEEHSHTSSQRAYAFKSYLSCGSHMSKKGAISRPAAVSTTFGHRAPLPWCLA